MSSSQSVFKMQDGGYSTKKELPAWQAQPQEPLPGLWTLLPLEKQHLALLELLETKCEKFLVPHPILSDHNPQDANRDHRD